MNKKLLILTLGVLASGILYGAKKDNGKKPLTAQQRQQAEKERRAEEKAAKKEAKEKSALTATASNGAGAAAAAATDLDPRSFASNTTTQNDLLKKMRIIAAQNTFKNDATKIKNYFAFEKERIELETSSSCQNKEEKVNKLGQKYGITHIDFYNYTQNFKEIYEQTMPASVTQEIRTKLKKKLHTIAHCAFCKETTKELKVCAKCQFAYYCSPECQKKDWSEKHQKHCHLYVKKGIPLYKLKKTTLPEDETKEDLATPQSQVQSSIDDLD
ncbi:zinc finger MYND domain-containing protein [Candidatus Babeliales bacterium]|nr:zinc finger MYND domain-containing protein [Candidatus Babeliales bacterium]